MREMKESNISWVGKIPCSWKVEKNKHCFQLEKNIVGENKDKFELLSLTKKGIIKKDENSTGGKVPESFETYQSVKKDQLVMCLFDLDVSAVFSGLSNYDGMISPAYKVYNCNKIIDKNYAKYWFECCFDGRKYKAYSKSLRYVVNTEDFGPIEILLPPKDEQEKIAKLLDKKIIEIDNVIEKTKETIEDYKKYKQSVITNMITKGIEKNKKSKNILADNLKEIPSDWRYMPLKYFVKLNSNSLSENTDENYQFKYVEIGAVSLSDGIMQYQEYIFKNAPSRARRIVKEGDIIVSTVRTYLKAIAIIKVAKDVIVSTGFAVLEPTNINKDYLGWVIKSDYFTDIVSAKSNGISYPAINSSDLVNIKIPVPSREEQLQLSNKLNIICWEIDKLISDKEKIIEELEQYKKSLIYEYVTGKKEAV